MPSSLNNPAPDQAKGDEEVRETPMLAELYRTLGYLEAGVEKRKREREALKLRVSQEEQEITRQRTEAEARGDIRQFNVLTAQLDNLRRAWVVLTHDPDGPDVPMPEGGL